MKPGRDLDKLVAVRVLGLKAPLCDYSSKLDAAMEVVKHLGTYKIDGYGPFRLYVCASSFHDNVVHVYFEGVERDVEKIATGDINVLPYLICLAALKALDIN